MTVRISNVAEDSYGQAAGCPTCSRAINSSTAFRTSTGPCSVCTMNRLVPFVAIAFPPYHQPGGLALLPVLSELSERWKR
jgi:hypothetical protein